MEIQIESELEKVSLPENNAKIKNSTKGYDIYLQYLKNVNEFKFGKFDLIIDAANGSAFKIIGPITDPPPNCCMSLNEILAECRPGITRILAAAVSRENG